MRAVIKLFNETFGIKNVFLFLMLASVLILLMNANSFELSDLAGPANVGFVVMLVMIGFGSNRGIITLVRSLPVSPADVAGGLQVSLCLMSLAINIAITLIDIPVKPFFLPDMSVSQVIGFSLMNTAFVIIMTNILLPVMLLKGWKPLKIAVTCLMAPMPYVACATAEVFVIRLEAIGPVLAACIISYVVALASGAVCHATARKVLHRYEA